MEAIHDSAPDAAIAALGERMWRWRSRYQPRSRDDIPRLDRPAGWHPDFAAETVAGVRRQRDEFAAELAALDPGPAVADVLDHRLLGSLLARVVWELDVVRAWQQQPRFYLDQALGPIFDILLPPGVDAERIRVVLELLAAIPQTLADGRANLSGHAVAEFADLAVAELAGIQDRLTALAAALIDLAPDLRAGITAGTAAAGSALADFRDYLVAGLDGMSQWQPVGAEQYEWYLREVAILPFTAEEMLAIGSAELDRAITLEKLSRHRPGAGGPAAPLPVDAAAQCAREAVLEDQVREFYVSRDLLSQPDSLGHYLNAPMPSYLEPLRFLGVSDDLTSPTRLAENGVSYVPEPTPDLPYFYAANARDPRAGIVHEGAHYQQLALSFTHPRTLRRHFYDSGANEGIAFYNEELTLAAGLFDDAPDTVPIIYNFMRLRALRVAVDVGLATGNLSIAAAAGYLAEQVPMDVGTATEEAAAFAEGPGQALSYQIGKTQIQRLVADAVRLGGPDTALRPLHDHLWRNGNVPIALIRWELLGLTDELDRIGVTAP